MYQPIEDALKYSPVVVELAELLLQRLDLAEQLTRAIKDAELPDINSVKDFFNLLEQRVRALPASSERLTHEALEVLFILNQQEELRASPQIMAWRLRYVHAIGDFLDSPASADYLPPYLADPAFRVEDYTAGPSGWRTFNQFFARRLRAGKRPIADPVDAACVVSPCDSLFAGMWPINNSGVIEVKGVHLCISELMAQSRWGAEFSNGSFASCFLRIHDYHRFHAPVAGKVVEVLNLPGNVGLDVVRSSDGELVAQPGTGFQFTQERGLIVLEFKFGFAAVLPVGMATISSVVFSADLGAEVAKGEELGFFQFGGSNVILLLSGDARWFPKPLDALKLGQSIARAER